MTPLLWLSTLESLSGGAAESPSGQNDMGFQCSREAIYCSLNTSLVFYWKLAHATC